MVRSSVETGKHVRMRGVALGLVALLATGGAAVEGQFIDGGEVSVNCTSCSCKGTSEVGPIAVVDNPSTGHRMVSVDGQYSDIAETSCGISAFAVGSTIYEISGIDLVPREFGVVDMSADEDCTTPSTPEAHNCYSGEVDKDLSEDLFMSLDLCICFDDVGNFTAMTSATVTGATWISIDEIEPCSDGGFVSELVTVAVEDDTYLFNFDLVIPGYNSSSTLQVASAPDASAEAFICGEEAAEAEPATTAPSSSPTPSIATSSPSPPPTPAAAATDAPGLTSGTPAPVEEQFIDGGEVSVTCTSCSCEGTSEAGPIMVLDNPSTGNRMVSVDGEYSDIAETSCGTSAFAVGSTIYEISGIDLVPREFEVLNMSADGNCATNSVPPDNSDCYSGEVAKALGDGILMTMDLCLCIQPGDSYSQYSVDVVVVGTSEVSLPSGELELCLDAGFFSQLVAVAVEDDTYLFNFDLVIPGEGSSSTLQVASEPDASAQSFICGGEASQVEFDTTTPSPIAVVTTAPTTVSPEDPDPEIAYASASTTSGTSGARSSRSRPSGHGGAAIAGLVSVVAVVLGNVWLASCLSTAAYDSR